MVKTMSLLVSGPTVLINASRPKTQLRRISTLVSDQVARRPLNTNPKKPAAVFSTTFQCFLSKMLYLQKLINYL